MVTEQEVLTGEIAQALGEVSALNVRLDLGVIKTSVSSGNGSGMAVTGDYRTSSDCPIEVKYVVEGTTGHLTIRQRSEREWPSSFLFEFHSPRLNLHFNTSVPISFDVNMGVGEADLDLSGLNVAALDVGGGVGKLTVTLPRQGEPEVEIDGGVGAIKVRRPTDSSDLRLKGMRVNGGVGSIHVELPERGVFPVDLETGVGALTLDLPAGLDARVDHDGSSFLSRLNVRRPGLTYQGHDRWQTQGYHEEAANRARIRVEAGIGSVTIR